MQLENQVVSLTLSTKLKELGVKQESLFCYQPIENEKPNIWPRQFNLDEFAHPSTDERTAAFTGAELGEMLPKIIKTEHIEYYLTQLPSLDLKKWIIFYRNAFAELRNVESFGINESNARAKMLIYLIENKLMEITNED